MGGKSSRPNKEKGEEKSATEPAPSRERNAGYTEIDEEQLIHNRQNIQKELNNKLSNGHHAGLTGKHSDEKTEENSGAAGKSVSPTKTRVHPYDEIELPSDDPNLNKTIVASTSADVSNSDKENTEVEYAVVTKNDKQHKDKKHENDKKEGKKNKNKERKNGEVDKQKKVIEKIEIVTATEETEAEYTNIEAIKAAVDDLYAKPQKPKKNVQKVEQAKQLNYIEVVVASKTGKSETKPQSPDTVTYSNVIKKEDGQIVLVHDPS